MTHDKTDEPNEVSDALFYLAKMVRYLGNGAATDTPEGYGAMEGAVMKYMEEQRANRESIEDGFSMIASAIRDGLGEIATAISEHGADDTV